MSESLPQEDTQQNDSQMPDSDSDQSNEVVVAELDDDEWQD